MGVNPGLILWEDSRLMFGNGVLRRIFGPNRQEVTGTCRKSDNEDLHYSYSSPNIIKVIKLRTMERAGHDEYKILVGKPDGKRLFRRPRHRLEDNIKMDLKKYNVRM
jgi:PAS domain-containing protein